MSVNASVFSSLQDINPSAIIELFTLQLSTALHGANTVYRFHAGSNLNANGKIVWATNEYLRFPIQATGFAFQRGQLPRPRITISNATGLISSILLSVNETTTGNDLTGATVTYQPAYPSAPNDLRYYCTVHGNGMGNTITMNDPNTTTQDTVTTTTQQVNPLGTPDPTAEFPQEIYKIDRKATETREIVQFELASVLDLAGIRAPMRQCTRTEFPSIGTFIA